MTDFLRTLPQARSFAVTLLIAAGAPLFNAAHAAGANDIFSLVLANRFEYQSNEGDDLLLWDVQGWVGGDYNKFWVKSEGEYLFEGGEFDEAEVQALYSRAIARYWDVQAGVRQDIKPDNPSRTFGVVGVQGLAPYWFELDAALFVSDDGDVEARIEGEYDLLVTQRLILQPRAELNFAFQDVEALGVGSGLSTAEAGVRLRYEIKRELAPYIGVAWRRSVGNTGDFARAGGENVGGVSFVVGLRSWF